MLQYSFNCKAFMEYKSLYEITGKITDLNNLIINRAELMQLFAGDSQTAVESVECIDTEIVDEQTIVIDNREFKAIPVESVDCAGCAAINDENLCRALPSCFKVIFVAE